MFIQYIMSSLAPDMAKKENEPLEKANDDKSMSVPQPKASQFGNPNGNYDQRRSETNAVINPRTNGSGGANERATLDGHSNGLGQVRM